MIKSISAHLTYSLRSLVLRAGRPVEECHFEKDGSPSSFHLAYYINNQIVSIASFIPSSNSHIQIRGMATHPDHRAQGFARALINHGEQVCKDKGFKLVWCNARENAQGFYLKNSYLPESEYFEIPDIGKHIIMKKNL